MIKVEKTYMIPMYYHVVLHLDDDSDYGPPEAYAREAADEGKSQYFVEGFASCANVYTEPAFDDIQLVATHANAAEEAHALLGEVERHLRRLRELAGESPAEEILTLGEAITAAVEYVEVQRAAHRRVAELCAFVNQGATT